MLSLSSMESKKGCKDQKSIQSSTTPDPGYQWESDKLKVRKPNSGVQPGTTSFRRHVTAVLHVSFTNMNKMGKKSSPASFS